MPARTDETRDPGWLLAPLLVLGAGLLGSVAGAMDWLLLFWGPSSGSESITDLGLVVLIAAHGLLLVLVVAHARYHWSWVLGLGAAGVCAAVVGFALSFFLALLPTALYEGHWSFG